ncbi:hypothetical protein C8R46DRAFT_1229750 [Mycena filopes]|nr:hypothetical protein C8R46DRAFT_1229750 [Mycena filopes]
MSFYNVKRMNPGNTLLINALSHDFVLRRNGSSTLTLSKNLEHPSATSESRRPKVTLSDERVDGTLVAIKRRLPDTQTVDPSSASSTNEPAEPNLFAPPIASKLVHPFFIDGAALASSSQSLPEVESQSGSPLSDAPLQTERTFSELSRPLLSLHERMIPPPKLTRSENGAEFYLFVEMRQELQWKASDMTSKKWANAVGEYNVRLARKVPGAIAKTPRALVNKLGEVERQALQPSRN